MRGDVNIYNNGREGSGYFSRGMDMGSNELREKKWETTEGSTKLHSGLKSLAYYD